MEHLRRLTPQQLVIAACGALVVAGTMLSHGNALGFVPLALAAGCGVGAFLQARDR
jgi:hypothetical protein